MKHFFTLLFFISLVGIIRVIAQPVLTAANNQPQAGDIIGSQYAYTTGVVIGSTGTNQVWDYSGLTDSAATAVVKFMTPSGTPYAATFPGANLAAQVVDTGTTAYVYFNATSTTTPVLGIQVDTLIAKYNHPLSTQNYPFTYPGAINDSSSIYFSNISGTLKDTILQLDTVTATGYGTLKLPGGVSYNNVLQVKMGVTTQGRIYIPGLGEIISPPTTTISYGYYTPGYHGPLLSYSLGTNGTSITDIYYRSDAVLPLRFISFTAASNKQGVGLNWQTGDELNTGHFNVQHSSDGSNFTNIGEVAAGGTGAHNYNFTDVNPSQGDNYYRIQEVDIDGQFTYSSVARVNFSNLAANEFYLINNPVQNILRVHIGVNSSNATLAVFDMTGKLVLRTPVTADGIQQIDASALTPGMYTIQYISATKKVSKKFVKQ